MDVSGSMSEGDRQLAKTFFFWVVQGLRRQYQYLETVFVAHTVDAWEFEEQEFFQVSGTGGTVASSAFEKVLDAFARGVPPKVGSQTGRKTSAPEGGLTTLTDPSLYDGSTVGAWKKRFPELQEAGAAAQEPASGEKPKG